MPAWWRKNWLAYWWSADVKPKGRMKRHIEGKNRAGARGDIRAELDAMERAPQEEHEEMIGREVDEAVYCHHYGPCDRCQDRENEE
jgi:hypothetical protein